MVGFFWHVGFFFYVVPHLERNAEFLLEELTNNGIYVFTRKYCSHAPWHVLSWDFVEGGGDEEFLNVFMFRSLGRNNSDAAFE